MHYKQVMKNKIALIFFLILILPMQVTFASKLTLEKQRKDFLLAEKSLQKKNNQTFFSQLEALKNYPLYPYLQYQWLSKNLKQANKIKIFLKNHAETRYAGLLNNKWLLYLAKHKKWREFLKHYKNTTNSRLQCYYLRAKFSTGAKKEALVGAKKIWVQGKSHPEECAPVFKALKTSRYFTREMLWQRFNAAMNHSKVQLAKYVKRLMNKTDQGIAQTWINVHTNPSLINKPSLLNKTKSQSGLIFAHAINRMASSSLLKAIKIWDRKKNNFTIDKTTSQRLEQRLAMALAYRRDALAYSRLSQLKNPDKSAKEWRVRAALTEQNWNHVEESIDLLSKENQKDDKWTYWLARALENTEKSNVANFMFTKLAKNRSYYGYLSADKINKHYELSDRPIKVTKLILERFKQKTDFRVVAELIEVDKLWEARRQWWYAVSKLENKDILIAAKYAQELQWVQIAIFTVAKAEYWDDISIRFPIAFEKLVQKNANVQQLNPAVIFGLIRRESAFNHKVKSPVGAIGLMQIMPQTGRQIARQLKEKWRSKNGLLNPSTNVKYGSYYYKRMLDRFNGHYALAAAAYNAGPHRVKRWLPVKNALAADIWIETIPFKETRAYVSAVLTYALIYQKKLKKNILSMKDFMRDVLPG